MAASQNVAGPVVLAGLSVKGRVGVSGGSTQPEKQLLWADPSLPTSGHRITQDFPC